MRTVSFNRHNRNAVDATGFSSLQMSTLKLGGVEQFAQVSELLRNSTRIETQAVCLPHSCRALPLVSPGSLFASGCYYSLHTKVPPPSSQV